MTVEFAAGPPSQWLVTLKSGALIQLAADAYTEEDGYALFSVLADASIEEQAQLKVLAAPSAGGRRVDFLSAKIPLNEVAKVVGGWPWGTDPSDQLRKSPVARQSAASMLSRRVRSGAEDTASRVERGEPDRLVESDDDASGRR